MDEVEVNSSLVQPHSTDVSQTVPEHSPPTLRTTETTMPETPADRVLLPAASTEPVMKTPTKAPELKYSCQSDQGCEPATAVPVGILVEFDTGED